MREGGREKNGRYEDSDKDRVDSRREDQRRESSSAFKKFKSNACNYKKGIDCSDEAPTPTRLVSRALTCIIHFFLVQRVYEF